MGIVSWHSTLAEQLTALDIDFRFERDDVFSFVRFEACAMVLNLLSVGTSVDAAQVLSMQLVFKEKGIQVVNLWEDVWVNRPRLVMGKIKALLGLNARIHARKTSIIKIGQIEADRFLEENHLQGSAKAKYRLALVECGQVVAVALFSNLRYMKKGGPVYRSAELIRFATLTGFTVTGGLTKLLKHFIITYHPDDIMSYADRDWSAGNAYERAGFTLVDTTPPAELWLEHDTNNRYFSHRLPQASSKDQFVRIFNSGNLKYVLYLHAS